MRGGRGISRLQAACVAALLLGVSACGGTPAATGPVESDDAPGLTPGATIPGSETTTEPDGTSGALDDGNGRPVEITLVISGSTSSDGSYTASGQARYCGNPVMNLTGNPRAFGFEFPVEGEHEIEDVTFSADDLAPGSTTPLFHIGVSVKAKLGGEPPSTVIHPDQPGSGDSGSAQLSVANDTRTLVVQGTNDFGDSISLTATCAPGQG